MKSLIVALALVLGISSTSYADHKECVCVGDKCDEDCKNCDKCERCIELGSYCKNGKLFQSALK